MSNYYTHFCCEIVVDTAAKKRFFETAKKKAAKDYANPDFDGTSCEVLIDGNTVYLEDYGGGGGVDYAEALILRYVKKFRIKKRITLSFACTADKHLPNAFGGGTVIIENGKAISESEAAEKYFTLKAFLEPIKRPDGYLKEGLVRHMNHLRSLL